MFLFFDVLSLLVIHLCECCPYQPQGSLWLALWYLCYLLNVLTPAVTMGAIYCFSLYMAEKKIHWAAAS